MGKGKEKGEWTIGMFLTANIAIAISWNTSKLNDGFRAEKIYIYIYIMIIFFATSVYEPSVSVPVCHEAISPLLYNVIILL